MCVEFPEFLGNTAVHERNLLEKGHDGTGRCPGSLEREVIQCCRAAARKGNEVRGWRLKEKCQMTNNKGERLRLRLRGWRREEKCQVTNNAKWTRTRESMSKFKVGNPWKTGKTNSERKGIWAPGHEQPKEQGCSLLKIHHGYRRLSLISPATRVGMPRCKEVATSSCTMSP